MTGSTQFNTTGVSHLEEIVIDDDAYDDALQPCDDGAGHRIPSDHPKFEQPQPLQESFHIP